MLNPHDMLRKISQPTIAAPKIVSLTPSSIEEAEKRGRGRPPTYTGEVLAMYVSLIRLYGATKTMRICHATDGQEAFLRPEGLARSNISMPTLLTMAKRAGIELHRGRRPKVVAKAGNEQTAA